MERSLVGSKRIFTTSDQMGNKQTPMQYEASLKQYLDGAVSRWIKRFFTTSEQMENQQTPMQYEAAPSDFNNDQSWNHALTQL